MLREELHRLVLQNKIPDLKEYRRLAAELEQEFLFLAQAPIGGEANPVQLEVIVKQAWQREQELVEDTVERSRSNAGQIRGNLWFRHYWQKQNERLGL